ncbi:MAG: VWA domain-containing protein [Gemmatimonadota bacterium]|nr:VWA domain-containing protein [Gemmatimonadota bacterium]
MGFGLLVPAFLAAMAALAVPIVLHLRHRDKDRPQRFPSLMFLEQLPIRTADRRRLTDLPLLLLRALALALLVLAFARPVFSKRAVALRSQQARAVVLMIDRSMSMAHSTVFKTAIDSAKAVVGSLRAADRVAVVLFDEEAEIVQALSSDKAAALAAINKARVGSRGTHYAAALRAAREAVVGAPEVVQDVIVITDLQRGGVSGIAGLDLPASLKVRSIAVGAKDRGNTSVASVEVRRIVEPTRTMLGVQTRISSRELKAERKAKVTLTLNGRASGTRDVTIPVSGDVPVSFEPVLLPAGRVSGSVTIDNDALTDDDTLHFALAADDAVRILLIVPSDLQGEETLYFERALAVGLAPPIRIERVRGDQLEAGNLAKSALVVLWDSPVPTGKAGDALADWVSRGGGLAVIAGRRLAARGSAGGSAVSSVASRASDSAAAGSPSNSAQATSAALPATGMIPAKFVGVADRMADRGGSIGDVRLDHPLFAPFRDASSALSAVRFLRYPRMEAASGAEVIARFDDGLPAVIDRRDGTGHIVLVGAPLDAAGGDFPLQPAYLPFLKRLVLYTSGHDAPQLWRTTGQSWLLPAALREPAVTIPDGSIVRPPRDTVGATVPLNAAGLYAVYDGKVQGEPVGLVAVNAPASESDLTPVDPRELLLGVRPSNDSGAVSNDIPTQTDIESKQRLWRLLLVAAALLLVGETLFSNRGWRGISARIGATPRAP